VSLRLALTANLPLKLTSLGLSVFLWFLAAGEEPASALLPVDVTVRAPAGRAIVSTAAPVRALVTGPRRELLKLTAAPLRITRVLPDSTEADQVQVELSPGDLEMPRGVVVPVQAVVRLQPETGRVLSAIGIVPGTVRILGPRDAIRRIDSVRTVPLEIERADKPVEETLAIDTSGFGRVRPVPGEVSVRVEVEAVGERTLTDVPVRLPSDLAAVTRPERGTVSVRVRGATTRLAALARDSVPVVVDWAGPPGPGRARLRVLVPAGLTATAEPDSVMLLRRGTDG
jgi:hypothetical protein